VSPENYLLITPFHKGKVFSPNHQSIP